MSSRASQISKVRSPVLRSLRDDYQVLRRAETKLALNKVLMWLEFGYLVSHKLVSHRQFSAKSGVTYMTWLIDRKMGCRFQLFGKSCY